MSLNQSQLFDAETGGPVEGDPEFEQEEDEVPRVLRRANALVGGKRPSSMNAYAPRSESESEGNDSGSGEGDEPEGDRGDIDLALYFARFQLPPTSQIALCRTYANYLAALARPTRVAGGPGSSKKAKK